MQTGKKLKTVLKPSCHLWRRFCVTNSRGNFPSGSSRGGSQDVQDPWNEARIGLEPSKEKRVMCGYTLLEEGSGFRIRLRCKHSVIYRSYIHMGLSLGTFVAREGF